MKRTPWFLRTTKPVRNGVYETQTSFGELRYSLWRNGLWGYFEDSISAASKRGVDHTAWQAKVWRGVLK